MDGLITNISIGDVINFLLKKNKITEARLAKAANMPRATINKICSGKIQKPRSDTLILIANYFDITIDQLVGSAPIYNHPEFKCIQVPLFDLNYFSNLEHKPDLKKINFINHANWIPIEIIEKNAPKATLFAVKISSDAMLPYFDDKTTIVIDSNAEVINRKYVLVQIHNTGEIILRQIFIDGNSKILKPINSIFKSTELTPDDLIFGVVIQTKRDF